MSYISKFYRLRRHLARVETALLDSMVEVYGSESEAEMVARIPEYKRFVLADLENATRRAYKKCQPKKPARRNRG